MKEFCTHNLTTIKILLSKLPDEYYTKPSNLLSQATIGQHVRHIVEFYLCLMKGRQGKYIEYDARERSIRLETDITFCLEKIDYICSELSQLTHNEEIILRYNMTKDVELSGEIKTSINRELLYCLDHSIHHQALIKIALNEYNLEELMDEDFGVAYSTIRNRNECAR